jgi:hypothetical protein
MSPRSRRAATTVSDDQVRQTRRAFLGRAVAFGVVLAGGWGSFAGSASAKKPKRLAWTPARNITGRLPTQAYAVAADENGRRTYFAKCDGNTIQFAQSLDEGRTFSAFKTIPGIANVSDVPLDRPLVVDPVTKRIHLAYVVHADDPSHPVSLFLIRSDDGGASWSKPLAIDDGVTHGTNRFIRVAMAARGGVVHIAWASISNEDFLTDGLLYARSMDGGNSFSAARRPFGGTVSPSRPDIALIGKTVLLAWTDARHGSAYNGNPGEVFVGRSTDGGLTWGQRRLTFTAERWGAGTTLRPVICAGSHGTATVVWQDPGAASVGGAGGLTGHNSPGTEDLYWVHSANAGASWSKIGILARGPETQNHAYLAQHGNLVACAWSDTRSAPSQLRLRLSTDGGKTFGPVVQPMVARDDVVAPRLVDSNGYFQAYAAEGELGVFQTRVPYRSVVAAR